MKDSEATTGLTNKEWKTRRVLNSVSAYYDLNKKTDSDKLLEEGTLNVHITRKNLNILLNDALDDSGPLERHTISSWINFLLSKKFLVLEKQENDKPVTENTKYFIDRITIWQANDLLYKKIKAFNDEKKTTTTP